jgi:hypothetical protein
MSRFPLKSDQPAGTLPLKTQTPLPAQERLSSS